MSFYTELAELAGGDTDFVLCTIEHTQGSTPRSKGAMMAVYFRESRSARTGMSCDENGVTEKEKTSKITIIGSVGGGRPEYECMLKAQEMLTGIGDPDSLNSGEKCSEDGVIMHFDLYPSRPQESMKVNAVDISRDEGAVDISGDYVCGGSMDISLKPVRHTDASARDKVLEAAGSHVSRKVYIFGGGHVCRALVPVLASVDFEPVVYEERSEFAEKELFPDAAKVICAGFGEIAKHITLEKSDFTAIMTRGHTDDYDVLKQILSTDVEYIGLMGSRSKRKFIFEKLAADGFSDADISRIHNPIGLQIGSETPQEIAISIAAELILMRAGRVN
ncbi:MAG: XdhC family protein [Lachnospiraceae bacterium]|nr:XdhC family protein [Lachnospiraceae bacterium]